MNAGLQEYARAQDHLTHFLTYADNNAVGYFAKQGFTKQITLDKERVSLNPLESLCASYNRPADFDPCICHVRVAQPLLCPQPPLPSKRECS